MQPFHSVAIALALAAGSSWADVLLETPVTYHENANVVEKVRSECKLEDQLVQYLEPMLAKKNNSQRGSIAKGENSANNTVLRLQITHVLGVGGGAWSGPKAITLNAELIEKGKVIRQTKINRWSTGGMWGGFKGTCSILARCSSALAKDLTRWSYDPSYKIADEAAPTLDASAASSAQ